MESAPQYYQQLFAKLYGLVASYLPVLIVVSLTIAVLLLAHWAFFLRHKDYGTEKRFPRQVAMLVLTLIGIIVTILAMPISDSTRGQLLSLLGLLLSAMIALSSTTFVANAMAGIMLRSVGSIMPGDFVRIGELLGRVTERGLFHMEIQTEDRDLTTLPNLYMVSQPVTVVHASGTIISTKLSLGYDVPRSEVEHLLLDAAEQAGLVEPFIQIIELGDYSVVYRIAGFLAEVKQLLSTRSNLCKQVLDSLHNAGIEIVSPAFMNQRLLAEGSRAIPHKSVQFEPDESISGQRAPEELIFDKADKAEKLEELRITKKALQAEIKAVEAQLGEVKGEQREPLEEKIARYKKRVEWISVRLEAQKNENS